jgi:hypothetical protein
MRMMWIALAGVALLGGCAAPSLDKIGKLVNAGPSVDHRPGANLPGGFGVNRRALYDERVARYYYFDTKSGRYYWENGDPRF